jgi:serine/threonine-protein kinase
VSVPFWPESIPPGTRIGPYTTGAMLGMGGTSVVYEARSPEGHLFALKVARQRRAVLEAPPTIDELCLERSIICHELLRGHPNVVQLYAYERHPDTLHGWPYQVLELVPGGQSITRWARQTTPSLLKVTHVFHLLAKALGDMHSRGIRHRDIKPENILMTPQGEPKLVDFGSARYIHTPAVTANAVWAQPGTPGYVVPEMCRELIVERSTGRPRPFSYEPSADLHSLGVVFYEVLTGHHPFNLSLGALGLLWQTANFEPVPPRELNPEVPEELEAIVMMLLSKDPQKRHETGYILARELELDELIYSQHESWSVPFSVQLPGEERTDGFPSGAQTAPMTEPTNQPFAQPVAAPVHATTALVRTERWPLPVRTEAPPRSHRPRGRHLAGYLAMAALLLIVFAVSRMMGPAPSAIQKGAYVLHPSTVITTTKMLTALVCASIGGCARVQVREADRDWLAHCSAKARESVHTLQLPRGFNTMARVLEGENVRYLPSGGTEVKAGPIKAVAHLGLDQPARLHGTARIGEDGVSMRFEKLTIGDDEGHAGNGPWPAGKEFEICAIAFDESEKTIGPGLPLDVDNPTPESERRPGSAVIISMHIDIRVAR